MCISNQCQDKNNNNTNCSNIDIWPETCREDKRQNHTPGSLISECKEREEKSLSISFQTSNSQVNYFDDDNEDDNDSDDDDGSDDDDEVKAE